MCLDILIEYFLYSISINHEKIYPFPWIYRRKVTYKILHFRRIIKMNIIPFVHFPIFLMFLIKIFKNLIYIYLFTKKLRQFFFLDELLSCKLIVKKTEKTIDSFILFNNESAPKKQQPLPEMRSNLLDTFPLLNLDELKALEKKVKTDSTYCQQLIRI